MLSLANTNSLFLLFFLSSSQADQRHAAHQKALKRIRGSRKVVSDCV
jgi:hypothetical protein